MIINLINIKNKNDITIISHFLKEFADYFKINCDEVGPAELMASDNAMQKFVVWLQEVKNINAKFFVIEEGDRRFARCVELDDSDAMMQTLKVGNSTVKWA